MNATDMAKKLLQDGKLTNDVPCFVYDFGVVVKNLAGLTKVFSRLHEDWTISFSLKTNPNLHLVKRMSEKLNLGFDVSSANELKFLKENGFDYRRVTVSGPGKTDECLKLAAQLGVQAIHVESIDELDTLLRLSPKCQVSLRLKTQDPFAEKLGMDDRELELALKRLRPGQLNGLHAYLGRESFSAQRYAEVLGRLNAKRDQFKSVLSDTFGLYLGPGLPHFWETTDLAKTVISAPVHFEVGRALVGSAGWYFAPVLSVKTMNSGRKAIIIEGGLQHLGSPMVSLSHGISQSPCLFIQNGKVLDPSSPVHEVSVFGSLCLWHDNLHPKLPVPAGLKRGDWIGFPLTGAYGLTAGVPHFIGERLPREYLLEESKIIDVTADHFKSYHECFGDEGVASSN